MIELKNVWKTHGNDRPALSGVSLHVETSEFIFLTGPSGAGKSTLLSLLFAREAPTKGEILFDGRDIAKLSRRDIPAHRRQIGFVFQDFKLLPRRTVFENVALAARITGHPESEQRIRTERVLKRIGLGSMLHKYPAQLSGGEQQRVALARAIVNDPPTLLADEPTGNLDPDLSIDMIGLLQQVNNRGTTVIVATHDRALIGRFPRRVLTLRGGKIIASEGEGRPRQKAAAAAATATTATTASAAANTTTAAAQSTTSQKPPSA